MGEPDITHNLQQQPTSSNSTSDHETFSNSEIDKILQSRYNIVSSAAAFADFDSLNDVVIDDITESGPTSSMLSFCKKRFLLPYFHILGMVGLRPMTVDALDWSAWVGHIQTLIIIVLLLAGYTFEFLMNFRRDRGTIEVTIVNETVQLTGSHQLYKMVHTQHYKPSIVIGETTFVYVIPSVIHFCGFLASIYMFRIVDNEHLQNLVERVFILCYRPIKLLVILWFYMSCGFIWLILMTLCIWFQDIHPNEYLKFKWLENVDEGKQEWAKILLLATVFTHDLVQMITLISYAIQCYLLRSYLFILKDKLLQNTMDPLDWMREMCEFRKLLHHLNKKIAIPICFFTVLNLIYTFSGVSYSFRQYSNFANAAIMKPFILNIGNITLWLIIGLFPFFQAAALTLACHSAQSSGHQVRIRPFVHHNTSSDELNSILLYSSSLRMSAKLFRMPIQANYLFFIILCLLIIVLTAGMYLNVSMGIV